MAREKVVKVCCDRCNRTELQPVASDKVGNDFEASFQGQRLVYEDLCLRCKETLKNLWIELKEWDREIKYTVLKNSPTASDQAVPLQPAPNYTPVQPHSAAAVKR